MAQRWLIGLGSLFVVLGVLLLATTVFRPLAEDTRRAADASGVTDSLASGAGTQPSPAWSAAGGLSLAIGAGLFGIGMNQWRRSERHSRRPSGRPAGA